MRRKLSILALLPAVNALSLANFQSITSILIPLTCQLVYDGQIPSCQVSDFNTGCTPACVSGLNTIAAKVQAACEDVSVTSSSLLGIIQAGNIEGALCPTLASTSTTTTLAKTTSAVPVVASVTIPTDSAGVTGGLGLKTSSTVVSVTASTTSTKAGLTSTSTATSADSQSSSSSTSSSVSTLATATTTSNNGAGNIATTSKTTSSATKAQQTVGGGSGGGSPFDISSGAERIGGHSNSMLSLVVFVGMGMMMLGR